MNNKYLNEECGCPLECNDISYSYYYVSVPFNPDEVCAAKNSKTKSDFLMRTFFENPMPPQMLRDIRGYLFNTSADPYELCKKQSQYRAEIIFRLATDTMTVTTTS